MGTVGTPVQVNGGTSAQTMVIASNKGSWTTCHANASATAQTAPELIRPGAVVSANVIPLEIGAGATRVLLRCRYGAAGAVTTAPTIRIIAAYGKGLIPGTSIPDDATVKYMILARAQAVPCVAATDVRDTTWSYSDPLTLTGTDMLGANYLIVFVEIAAVIAGAGNSIEAMVLN